MSQVTYLAGLWCPAGLPPSAPPGPRRPTAWGHQQPADGWRRMATTSLSLSDSRLSLTFLFLFAGVSNNATQVARTGEISWVRLNLLNLCLQCWRCYCALHSYWKAAELIIVQMSHGCHPGQWPSSPRAQIQWGKQNSSLDLQGGPSPSVHPAVCMFPQPRHVMCLYVGVCVWTYGQVKYKSRAKDLLKSGCNELLRPDILTALYQSAIGSKVNHSSSVRPHLRALPTNNIQQHWTSAVKELEKKVDSSSLLFVVDRALGCVATRHPYTSILAYPPSIHAKLNYQ